MVRAAPAARLRLRRLTRRPLTWLDVFAAAPLEGNGLLVVHDADGMTDVEMLAVTREVGLSEAAFVQAATAPGADYRIRIFTAAAEVPFAGHPSLGAAAAVARTRGEASATYTQQTLAGLQPLSVRLAGPERYRVSMRQAPAVLGPRLAGDEVAAVLGSGAEDLDRRFVPQVVSTGVPHVIAPVTDPDVLRRMAPADHDELDALLAPHGALTLYLVHLDDRREVASARAFFCAQGRVREDPATGSAAGALMAYLREARPTTRLRIHQGASVGRPSVIDCSWEDGVAAVAGDVLVIATGASAG